MSQAVNLSQDQAQQVIYNRFLHNGIPDALAKLATAQSGHETGGWTSNVWLNDNNGFGYGYDGSGNYTVYPSVEDSVDALAAYMGRRVQDGKFPDLSTITDAATYAALLKNAGYYGDNVNNYLAGIQRWYNSALTMTGIGVGAIVVVGMIIYLIAKRGA